MPKLSVVRHGPTVLNEQGRLRGWMDPELSEVGHAQAKMLPKSAGPVYCSDLRRSVQTAEYIGTPRPFMELRPWHVGAFAGHPTETVHPILVWFQRNPGVRAPDGEAWSTFVARFTGFMRTIDHDAVLVTHFRNCKVLQAYDWEKGILDEAILFRDDVQTLGVMEVVLPW